MHLTVSRWSHWSSPSVLQTNRSSTNALDYALQLSVYHCSGYCWLQTTACHHAEAAHLVLTVNGGQAKQRQDWVSTSSAAVWLLEGAHAVYSSAAAFCHKDRFYPTLPRFEAGTQSGICLLSASSCHRFVKAGSIRCVRSLAWY